MLITLSRRDFICLSVSEVWLIGVAPLVTVSHDLIFLTPLKFSRRSAGGWDVDKPSFFTLRCPSMGIGLINLLIFLYISIFLFYYFFLYISINC